MSKGEGIDFSGSEISFNGELFTGDAAKKLKENLAVHVGALTKAGRTMVVSQINSRAPSTDRRSTYPSRRRTGFTAKSIEAYQEPKNSLYGKVRVAPDLKRPGAKTTKNGQTLAERVPYVIMATLETGRRGGTRGYRINVTDARRTRARVRNNWQHGARKQPALFAFRRTATAFRRMAPQIREAVLLRGLR